MTHPLFRRIVRLNNFRRLYPALTLGSFINRASNSTGPGLFAFSRVLPGQEVLGNFNTAGSSQTMSPCTLSYSGGTILVNLLDTNETCTLNAGHYRAGHDGKNVHRAIPMATVGSGGDEPFTIARRHQYPDQCPIILQFSQPMSTNSAQSAFSTSPAVGGTFIWSAAHDLMTFTPGGAGLPPLTTVFVNVTNSAVAAVSSNAMFAPYQMAFHTGYAWHGRNHCIKRRWRLEHQDTVIPYDYILTRVNKNCDYCLKAPLTRLREVLDSGSPLPLSGALWFSIAAEGCRSPRRWRAVGNILPADGYRILETALYLTLEIEFNIMIIRRNKVSQGPSRIRKGSKKTLWHDIFMRLSSGQAC